MSEKIVVSKLIGGLGNQMFQYSLGRRMAIKNNARLVLDVSHYEEFPNLQRKYDLECFKLTKLSIVAKHPRYYSSDHPARNLLRLLGYPEIVVENGFSFDLNGLIGSSEGKVGAFDPSVLRHWGNIYLVGFWNNEKYFTDCEEQIRSDFTFRHPPTDKNSNLLGEISKNESVSLHVRRGDYASVSAVGKTIGLASDNYYRKAVDYIKSKTNRPIFYIFSDDPEWCRKSLKISGSVIIDYNSPSDGHEDMRLMAACKHNIIANSTFSWWAAWLNPNPDKIVIAPKVWFRDKSINTKDVVPSKWVKL